MATAIWYRPRGAADIVKAWFCRTVRARIEGLRMTEESRTDGGAGAPGGPDDDIAVVEPVAAVRRLVTEDWAATILGLVLLLLALVGVITKGMIP